MNYIVEINAFYDWLESNPLTPNAIALWHALMATANKAHWPGDFSVAISTLLSKTGMGKDAVYSARNLLRQKGRIDFQEKKGRGATAYILIPFVPDKPTQTQTKTPALHLLADKPTKTPPLKPHFPLHFSHFSSDKSQNINKYKYKRNVIEKEGIGVAAPTHPEGQKNKPTRHKHGEYGWVLLTDEEYSRLVQEYGEDVAKGYIAYIDESAQQTGNKNKWKDWNLTIRKAIREGWGNKFPAIQKSRQESPWKTLVD